MRFVRILIAVALLFAFTALPALAETDFDTIQASLMCQCGCTMVVNSCDCGTAEQMRGEIRDMLGKGKSIQQVLDYYVGKYGEKVLAAPTKQGFNLTAYITPFAGIVVAGSSVYLVLRQWVFRGRKPGMEGTPDDAPAQPETAHVTTDDLRAQLQRDLENYD